MEMEPLSFENVDIQKINQQVELESTFNLDLKSNKKGKQTTISNFAK
jgi:hypothetical protein